MALLATIGMDYVQGQSDRARAIKEAVNSAKKIPTPVATSKPKAKAKAEKKAE